MQFKILNEQFTFASLEDIKLSQLLQLEQLDDSNEAKYIVDYVHILTGVDKDVLLRANLDDLANLINHVNEIITKAEHKETKHIILDGKRLKLPTWQIEAKAIFTDLTLQRYALMEQLATSIKGINEGETDKIAALLACLYTMPNEKFTDKLFLKRKDLFLNADLNTIYNAFFLQTKRLNRFTKYINYYLKALEVFAKRVKKKNRQQKELTTT